MEPSKHAILPEFLRPVSTSLVRLGARFDGGYVVSSIAVDQSTHLLSFGINTDWSFESDFLEQKSTDDRFTGIDAWDPTLNPWRLSRSTIKHIGRRAMGRDVENIGTWSSYVSFFGRPNVNHHRTWIGPRLRPNTQDIDQCMKHLPTCASAYVKMDIEGSEYDVLDQLNSNQTSICGMSIEFHDVDRVLSQNPAPLESLHKYFEVVHVHANNFAPLGMVQCPRVIEVSYINRRLISLAMDRIVHDLPNPELDRPNKRSKPDYIIRFSGAAQAKKRRAA